MNRVPVLLIFMLSIFCDTTSGQTSGECIFPTSWRTKWYKSRNDQGVLTFQQFSEKNMNTVTSAPGQGDVTSDQYVCQDESTGDVPLYSNPFYFFIRTPPANTNQRDCIEMFNYGDNNQVIVQKIKTGVADIDVSQCSAQIGTDDTLRSNVLIKYPFTFTATSCPFESGTYQVEYAETSMADEYCKDDLSSEVTVDGNEMRIRTCSGSGRTTQYAYPYNTELTCLKNFSPIVIDSPKDDGDVVVLAYKDPSSGDYSFYCARYKIDKAALEIRLSLNAYSQYETFCENDANFNTALELTEKKYRRFIMKPNNCDKGECLNGATCVQDFGGFECQCLSGYTGDRCEININDCVSSPCQNGGTCVDGVNRYTCSCTDDYYGDHCQFEACDLPSPWLSGVWWKDYNQQDYTDPTLLYFQRNSITYSTTAGEKTHFCEVDESDAFHYFTLQRRPTDDRTCVEARTAGSQVIMYRDTGYVNKPDKYTVSECRTLLGDRTEMQVLVNVNMNPQAVTPMFNTCPFPNVRFQVMYSSNTNTVDQCQGVTSSKVDISGSTMTFDTCAGGAHSYDAPYNGDLFCVDYFTETTIDDSPGNGDILILAYQDPTSTEFSFYCARYSVQGTQVFLSVNHESQWETKCSTSKDYTELSNTYFTLEITSNICATVPCLNGGTCTDTYGSFTCKCVPGYTGNICQTDINECLSRPCQNGGTCVDEVNQYRCNCKDEYYGDVCQYGACDLPTFWRRPNRWWTSYLNDDVTQPDILEFTKTGYTTSSSSVDRYCENDETTNDITYTSWRVEPSIDTRLCAEGRVQDNILLYRETQEETKSVPLTVSECITKLNTASAMNLYVSYPFQFSGSCPFPSTSYQVTYSERSGVVNQCANELASEANVNGDQIDIISCSTADTYQRPFTSVLTCVASFSSLNIDGVANSPNGDVLILAKRDDATGAFSFYCARYKIIDNQVHMSLNAGSPYEAQCRSDRRYDYYDQDHRYFKFTSNLCSRFPCNNGATCEDLMADYVCNCLPGYTGRTCDIDINECASDPCQNAGTCIDQPNSYSCSCRPGFRGTHCEDYDECASNPCQNGATCAEDNNRYYCNCARGWTGERCEIELDECASNPCKNEGTCIDQFDGYMCICAPGVTGINCDININECDSQPCVNGGTCHDRVNGYYCRCTEKYIGVHCEHFFECWSNPCQNEGVCQDDLEFFTCLCPSAYTGDFCELEVTSCTTNPCENGAECRDTTDGYTCDCANGYYGTTCQFTDACAANPCQNGGECVRTLSSFSCECKTGWTGTTCTTKDTNDGSTDDQTGDGISGDGDVNSTYQLDQTALILIIVCSILFVLVIIIIIILVMKHNAAKAAKKKMLIYSNGSPRSGNSWYPEYKRNGAPGDAPLTNTGGVTNP